MENVLVGSKNDGYAYVRSIGDFMCIIFLPNASFRRIW
jgi:hypothetical protein